MSADRLRQLNERIAELFRDDWPIWTRAEPPPGTSVDLPTIDEAVSEASVTEIACAAENAPTMTEQPRSVLDGLSLDTAIRLRWALRDIKAKRTKLSPVSQNDLMALIELGLIEMRDDVPQLTNEGHRAIDWNWIHEAVMALPPDERRDRAKVNEAVRGGIRLGPLRPAGSADLYGVPKATE